MRQELPLACDERRPGRPFTDPEHTLADVEIMSRMIDRLRLEAEPIRAAGALSDTSVELREDAAGCRHWIVIPRASVLAAAEDVTAVGFFGDLRAETDHAPLYKIHRGAIAGPFIGTGALIVERTRYFDFSQESAWHGIRNFA